MVSARNIQKITEEEYQALYLLPSEVRNCYLEVRKRKGKKGEKVYYYKIDRKVTGGSIGRPRKVTIEKVTSRLQKLALKTPEALKLVDELMAKLEHSLKEESST